jgi:hypothetical protein
MPLPEDMQNSHRNGGRGLLIFVADPNNRPCCRAPHHQKVYTEKAIKMVGAAAGLPFNGHHIEAETSSKTTKKPAKRGGNGHDSGPAEVGQDELLGQQQPGDAVTAD